jgi:hypothetical protein
MDPEQLLRSELNSLKLMQNVPLKPERLEMHVSLKPEQTN